MTTLHAENAPHPMMDVPPPSDGMNPWLIRVPILAMTGFFLLMMSVAGLFALVHVTYDARIAPGVYVMDQNVGGMTPAEAEYALAAYLDQYEAAVFTFRDGEQAWQYTAGELGLTVDAAGTAARAFSAGRGSTAVDDLAAMARAWLNGRSVSPIVQYDQSVAAARLQEIAQEINQPASNTTISIEDTQVRVSSGSTGRTVDLTATLDQLNPRITELSSGSEIALVINEMPPLIANTDEAVSMIEAAFSGPLELYAEDANGTMLGPWTVSVDQISRILALELVENADGSLRYQPHVQMNAFADYLQELAAGLIVPPRDGRFRFDPNTGRLIVTQPAQTGRTLNVEQTLARLESAVFNPDERRVPMAFDLTLPRYHDGITAAELGITELVAEATTLYTGSGANRRHNIAHGAALFDGIIIGPGEEFSFNHWLGEMSTEAGFVESSVIVGERTVDGIGGGICQVSTTVFRAALFGGFTIIERNSHAYRVGFYELNAEPGLDAAIWTPDRDFRFQNDTPYHLLIETSVYPANNSLQFRFYSTNPGRQVEIQQPIVRHVVEALPAAYEVNGDLRQGEIMQVDWAAEGADVTVYRIIRDLDGNEIKRDSIFTHYLPWRAVYQVPPGDPRLNN